jgi:hypothetical protein
LTHEAVPQSRPRQGKITALAIAFVVPTEIRKQLEQPLLLACASDESKQDRVIAEHPMAYEWLSGI